MRPGRFGRKPAGWRQASLPAGPRTSSRRFPILLRACGFLLLASGVGSPGEATGNEDPQRATWVQRDILVNLQHLPVRYTCENLRVKVRDVLLHLGVRDDAVVQPRRCEPALGSAGRSPRLRLKYRFLAAAGAAENRAAEVLARAREIRIAPGEPASIKDSDCDLLRQLRPHLPGKAVRYRVACRAAPRLSSERFVLVFRTLSAESRREAKGG